MLKCPEVDISKLVKLSLYEISKKYNLTNEQQLRDKVVKVFYKLSKKYILQIVWNGNFLYPYSQDIEDIFYELIICGQSFSTDFTYLEKYLNDNEKDILNSIKNLI